MKWINGGVTAARGFLAAGCRAGIKKSRALDLALVTSQGSAASAGVFTTNLVQAAPVRLSRSRLRKACARAIFINSGCANCLTGPVGMRDAVALCGNVARKLCVGESEVLVASTGLIGSRLPVDKIKKAIPALIKDLSRSGHRAAAKAILTTDLLPKEAAVEAKIGGRICRVGGMVKGAGMIAPSMATMICVLTTDIAISPTQLRTILQKATDESFNRMSVDGDMSTNDTVFALASGCSGARIRSGSTGYRIFYQMVQAVCYKLARAMIEDGEGSTRAAEIEVVGARSDQDALRCARHVASSNLVKTMLAGGDPNVGRVAASVGAAEIKFSPERLEISIGGRRLVRNGCIVNLSREHARKPLRSRWIKIRINLNAGRGEGRMLTCDLTEAYVRFNTKYTT